MANRNYIMEKYKLSERDLIVIRTNVLSGTTHLLSLPHIVANTGMTQNQIEIVITGLMVRKFCEIFDESLWILSNTGEEVLKLLLENASTQVIPG